MRNSARAGTPWLLSTASVALLAGLTPSRAASADAAESAGVSTQDASGNTALLEEVVVTARKSSESLMRVPVAVTALSRDDIERANIRSVADVAVLAPGFNVQTQTINRNDRGFTQYNIRGIIPAAISPGRQTTTLFVDGQAVLGGVIPGLTDIDHVEVVKGPQSAYFGRSTFAGAINLITRQPGNVFRTSINAEAASFGTTDLSGSIEGPLIADKLTARLSARDYHTDGPYSNFGYPGERLGEQNTQSAALSLYATPTSRLRLKLFATTWEDEDGPPANAQYDNAYFNCNGGGAPAGTLNYYCGAVGSGPADTRVSNVPVPQLALDYLQGVKGTVVRVGPLNYITHVGLRRDADIVRLGIDYDLPNNYNLGIDGSYGKNHWIALADTALRDTRSIPNPLFGGGRDVLPEFAAYALLPQLYNDHAAEIRLTSPRADRFKWSVGTNYYHAEAKVQATVFSNAGPFIANAKELNESDTYGLFGSVEYDLSDAFSISAEARYQEDTIKTATPATGIHLDATFSSFTPRVILDYHPATDLTFYASYSEGTRPGAFNATFIALPPEAQEQIRAQANVPVAVPEEQMQMVELGTKGLFLDGRLRVLAAIYGGRWSDRQVPSNIFYNVTGTPAFIAAVLPGGLVDLSGFEIEAKFLPIEGLTIEAKGGMADTEIKRTICTSCLAITGDVAPVGTQLPFYPKYTASASVAYERALFDDFNWFGRIDSNYRSQQYDSEANVAWTPDSTRVNVSLGIGNDKYRVELFGNNIFDDDTPTSLSYNFSRVTSSNAVSVSLTDPRAYGVRILAEF